ncbi:hypothetical protein [Streptomyces sp. NPDC048057]|uniref:hypothetical protein n=1 Tax=Streptomyces sp. NPDC048057 TaxID=3155628 RepID=UPI0033FDBA70
MTQKNTNTSAGEFITSRGAAQVAPATAFDGVSPRERHSPAPPAPPTTATADQGEPTSPADPTVPTTPPATQADAQVDTTTDAPAEGGAPAADTNGSTPPADTALEDEIVTMERHSPMPPPPRD